jgi:hypothetical protein
MNKYKVECQCYKSYWEVCTVEVLADNEDDAIDAAWRISDTPEYADKWVKDEVDTLDCQTEYSLMEENV